MDRKCYEMNEDNEKVPIERPEKNDTPATSETAKPARRPRKKLRPVIIILNILIVVLAASGLYLIVEPYYLHWQQDKMTTNLENAYLEGDGTIYIDPEAYQVPGEEAEIDETFGTTVSSESGASSDAGSTAAPTPTPAPVKVVIKAIGQIKIPSINVNMPIAEGSTRYNLRVAISHYSNSAAVGQPGLSIFLGHRMYTYGRHFNRLDEVVIGDLIIIENKQYRYTYEVDQIDTVLPNQLGVEFNTPLEGSRIMLVTCTPIRIASHRLLVKGKLISTEPLS
jgi:sortase A